MVQSGVGKVNAAICAAKCAEPARFRTVINLGVCGALPAADGKTPPGIGAVVLADLDPDGVVIHPVAASWAQLLGSLRHFGEAE